jgi:hypothetical protein
MEQFRSSDGDPIRRMSRLEQTAQRLEPVGDCSLTAALRSRKAFFH